MDLVDTWYQTVWWKLLLALEDLRDTLNNVPKQGKEYPFATQSPLAKFALNRLVTVYGNFVAHHLRDAESAPWGPDDVSPDGGATMIRREISNDVWRPLAVTVILEQLRAVLPELLSEYQWGASPKVIGKAAVEVYTLTYRPRVFEGLGDGDVVNIRFLYGDGVSIIKATIDSSLNPIPVTPLTGLKQLITRYRVLLAEHIPEEVFKSLRSRPSDNSWFDASVGLFQFSGLARASSWDFLREAAKQLSQNRRKLVELLILHKGKCELSVIAKAMEWDEKDYDNAWQSLKRNTIADLGALGHKIEIGVVKKAAVMTFVSEVEGDG